MPVLLVALLLLPVQALRLEEGGQAVPKLSDATVNLAIADDTFEPQAWDYSHSDQMSGTVDLLSWTAIIRQANVPSGFKASLKVSEKDSWMMTFPMWFQRTGLVDYSGCPPFPEKGVFVSLSESGELCFSGKGYQTRAASTFAMFQEAAGILRARRQRLKPFGPKSIGIGDNSPCSDAMVYSTSRGSRCKARVIPDFTFWMWPEAHLLPNFTVVSNVVERLGRRPAEEERCLWIGNPGSHHAALPQFEEAVQSNSYYNSSYTVLHSDRHRLTMEEQTKWACLVDVPCQGYSGRVPLLLHTGRPVVMIERMSSANPSFAKPTGYFVDNTWYSQFMEPWVHYIPLYANFSNLKNVTRVALGEEGRVIGRNAVRMARQKLTTKAALEAMADALLAIQGDDPSPTSGTKPSPTSRRKSRVALDEKAEEVEGTQAPQEAEMAEEVAA